MAPNLPEISTPVVVGIYRDGSVFRRKMRQSKSGINVSISDFRQFGTNGTRGSPSEDPKLRLKKSSALLQRMFLCQCETRLFPRPGPHHRRKQVTHY